MDKKEKKKLSESDICDLFISPAIRKNWGLDDQHIWNSCFLNRNRHREAFRVRIKESYPTEF